MIAIFFIKFLLGVKLVLIERTPIKELKTYYSLIDYFKKKIIYLLMKLFYSKSNAVIVNSNYTKKKFKKNINCKVFRIFSPAIEKVKIKKKRYKKNFYNHNLKILSIGRLSKEKNFSFLIQAASYLKNLNFNFEIRIVGNGIEKKKLNEEIKNSKLSSKIKILNFNKKKKYILIGQIFMLILQILKVFLTLSLMQ